MTDDQTPATPAQPPSQPMVQPRLQILTQCIRDVSFENAQAQKGQYSGEMTPVVEVQVSLDARRQSAENRFEVIQKYRITAKDRATTETVFVIELDYGVLVAIDGVAPDQMHPFLLIEVPRQAFPWVQRIVADLTRDGGFPPLRLEQIDFLALYRQEIARRVRKPAAGDAQADAQPTS